MREATEWKPQGGEGMSHVDILGKSRGNNNFQDLKAGAYLRNSKEASVEVSDEGREQEVRMGAGGQSMEGLEGYGKNLGFYSEWNGERLQGFEQRDDMIRLMF